MPGRTSTRSTRTSTAATKKGRTSSTRQSANAVEIPDEGPVTSLRQQIAQVFGEAYKTTATQRKLAITLRKIQVACCYERQDTDPKGRRVVEEDYDEEDFATEIEHCISRIIFIKKSEPAGDKLIRFLGVFLNHAYQKDIDMICKSDPEADPEAGHDICSSRLAARIILHAFNFLQAKDKSVRYRASQLVAYIFNSISYVDNQVFHQIRLAATRRLHDKEASVRTQAALTLGRISAQDAEDESEDSEDDDGVVSGGTLNKLLDLMAHDQSAEVRRTVLRNILLTPESLRSILERARDQDAATRRLVYTKVLPHIGDFRYLSLIQREKVIRWGLTDRDDNVRKSAARLFREKWLEDCARAKDDRPEEEKKASELAPPSMEALEELLERIDIVQSTGKEQGVAHDAMQSLWEGRPDYCEALDMDRAFWEDNLDPYKAFIGRTYNDHCRRQDDITAQEMVDDKMPDIRPFAYILQLHLNRLVEARIEAEELDGDEEEMLEAQECVDDKDFVAQQLLHIALTLDYLDHEGRTQMYNIMRGAIARQHLSERCTELAVEVLRRICGSHNESDFCSLIQEAIAEIRDSLQDADADEDAPESSDVEESFHSAMSDVPEPALMGKKKVKQELSPEEEEIRDVQRLKVYIKCLDVAKCALQNVECDFESENALMNILNTLIVPAVQSHQNPLRERGLVCLGLAAQLSKNLAEENMDVFIHCLKVGHNAMKEIAVQIICDLVLEHPSLLAPLPVDPDATGTDAEPQPNPNIGRIVKMLLKTINRMDNESLSYIACIAACKFLLMGVLPVPAAAELLKTMTLIYFDAETIGHPAITQALAYVIPAFCHSQLKNAQLLAQITVPIMSKLLHMREETLEEHIEDLVSWTVITTHLADWTDGRKVVGATELGLDGKMNTRAEAEEPHILMAIEILERVLSHTSPKDERKPLLSLLSKLHIAPASSAKAGESELHQESLTTLHGLVVETMQSKIPSDATQRNHLAKLEATLTKRLGEIEHVTQAQDAEESTMIPTPGLAEDNEATEAGGPERPSVDLSEVAEEEGEDDEEDDEETMLAGMQGEGTRMPLEEEEEEEEEDGETEDASSTTTTEMPVKKKPRRSAVTVTESDIMDELLESEMSV